MENVEDNNGTTKRKTEQNEQNKPKKKKKSLFGGTLGFLLTKKKSNTMQLKKQENPFKGLQNLGNTCYANVILQLLAHQPNFLTAIKHLEQKVKQIEIGNSNSNPLSFSEIDFLRESIELFDKLNEPVVNSEKEFIISENPCSLIQIVRKLASKFKEDMQEDAHEFLVSIITIYQEMEIKINNYTKSLEKLQNLKLNDEFTNEKTVIESHSITKLMEGKTKTVLCCLDCEFKVEKEESFLSVLSIPIYANGDSKNINNCCSVSQCLNWFCAKEFLNKDNKYFCNFCQTKTETSKFNKISSLPPLLCLHMLSFTYSEKICKKIVTPFDINFSYWLTENISNKSSIYSLNGIIFHNGTTQTCGHYIIYLRNKETKENNNCEKNWICFDDDTVTFVSDQALRSLLSPESSNYSTVYMLFFELKNKNI